LGETIELYRLLMKSVAQTHKAQEKDQRFVHNRYPRYLAPTRIWLQTAALSTSGAPQEPLTPSTGMVPANWPIKDRTFASGK
jgi:hypothetical protein